MATDGVSSTRASSVSVSQTNGNAQRTASVASADQSRAKSARTQTPPRQVINIDGKSFDRRAPRGTYLNILA
jgi:hypothetical protein